MSILVVEDEEELSHILSYVLRRAGFDVLTASDGMSALRLWKNASPSLILLDLNLPRLGGWEVCRQVRLNSATPIVMLTGQKSDEEIVRGLNVGADDYITKPFSPAQLVARIEAVLRRANQATGDTRARYIGIGDLKLDMQTNQARIDGHDVQLTNLEFRLLHTLCLREGHVVRHHELIQRIWGYQGISDGRMLKSHVRNLRRKIEPDPSRPRYVHTIPSVGYRFTSAPAAVAAASA
ncbi:MAG: response regulator [Dehalococcoidia bacterium]